MKSIVVVVLIISMAAIIGLIGCTEEKTEILTAPSEQEYGVFITYPTAEDTVEILLDTNHADTIVYGSVFAQLPGGIVKAQIFRRDEEEGDFYIGDIPPTYPTSDQFDIPIMHGTMGWTIEGIVPCWIRVQAEAGNGERWNSRNVMFHISYVDTTQ